MSDFESWVDEQFIEINHGLKLSLPGPSQSLFKYISLDSKTSFNYLEQTVNEWKLIGQTARGLNDPFELFPAAFDDLRPKVVEFLLRGDQGIRRAGLFDDVDVDYYRRQAREYMNSLRGTSRVVAFSDRYDSPLLWAHYANSYKGACLHFLGGKLGLNKQGNLGSVNYSEQRPLYPLSLALALSLPARGYQSRSLARAESDKLISFTKAADWAYEREYRVVYSASQRTHITFNPESLASIIVGPGMGDDELSQLLDVVSRSASSLLPIRRARTSSASFAVTVDWERFATAEEIRQGARF